MTGMVRMRLSAEILLLPGRIVINIRFLVRPVIRLAVSLVTRVLTIW